MKYRYLALLAAAALCACSQQESAPDAATPAASSAAASAPAANAPAAPPKNGGFFGTDVSKDDIGGDFTLTDGSGKPFALSSLKGKVVLLTFGYTNCPDVCPTSLLTYSEVTGLLGDKAKDVAVVFVSVDPERDTPEVADKFAKTFNPDFIGLTATGDQSIPVVKQQYRVVSAKSQEQSADVYLIDHTAGTYVLDKNGNTVLMENYGRTSSEIAADVQRLLES
ncbi:BsSco [Kingella potus]|uniref:BsSco n=1 Tax=Kingella potus TaxID=265175 RepID=A0A377R1U2_9NEIS|nr:SCO family protein [Kingella potus]STR00728.1 BsSco [Kingella potus]